MTNDLYTGQCPLRSSNRLNASTKRAQNTWADIRLLDHCQTLSLEAFLFSQSRPVRALRPRRPNHATGAIGTDAIITEERGIPAR